MADRRVAYGLIAVGFMVGLIYAFTTPLWQAPDEPSHFGYIEHIDRTHALPSPLEAKIPSPVQAKARENLNWPVVKTPLPSKPKVLPAEEFAYRDLMYTANHPPLYYLSSATFARVGAGLAGDRLTGLAYGARVFSALLIGLTVGIGFLCARLTGLSRANALLVASLLILQPQYMFIASSINNDSLVILLWTVFVYLILREIRRPDSSHPLAVGTILGLGLLTKITFFLALPLTVIGFSLADRSRSRREPRRRAAVAIALALSISGWWFVGNIIKYGSPWYIIGGTGLGPASLSEFFSLSLFYRWLYTSYWGYFGWMEKPLPGAVYRALGVMVLMSAVGVAGMLARSHPRKESRRVVLFLILSSTILFAGAAWFRIVAQTGQGRYLFPSIVPSTILLWVGLRWWVPDRLKSWAAHATLLFFGGLSVVGLTLIRGL